MIRKIDIDNIQEVLQGRKLVIFGYGRAGKTVSKIIDSFFEEIDYCFCDNDTTKHDSLLKVYAVHDVIKDDPLFLVVFKNDNEEKTASALECLKSCGVKEDSIIIVSYNSCYDKLQSIEFLKAYVNKKIEARDKNAEEKLSRVVFTTAYYDGVKKKCGGPAAALMMQKSLLEDNDEGIEMLFPISPVPEKSDVIDYANDIVYTVSFASGVGTKQAELYGEGSLFVANDMWNALGLFLAGKRYCLIHHAQGDMVCEYLMWGKKLSNSEIAYLKELEQMVVENAIQVRFPSKGAELFFRKTYGKDLAFQPQFPLYNTIFDYSEPTELSYIRRESEFITFFSIGQFTKLKGMDRIPSFLEQYLLKARKKIRWIVVADGVLKEDIKKELERIKTDFQDTFEYLVLSPKFSREEIYYLFQISDVYIMLHRISIFDFSTLEAMYMGKAIILSNIAGNDEFNKENNILLVDSEHYDWEKIIQYIDDIDENGRFNKKVYADYFSQEPFKKAYFTFLKEVMENA